MTSTPAATAAISRRLGLASSTMGQLDRVWRNKKLSTPTKIRLYSTCVLLVLLYGSKTWILLAEDSRRVQAFYMTCHSRILGIQCADYVTKEDVQRHTKLSNVFEIITKRRHSLFGHVRWLDPSTPAHAVLRFSVDSRSGIRPRSGWRRSPVSLIAHWSHSWRRTREYLLRGC